MELHSSGVLGFEGMPGEERAPPAPKVAGGGHGSWSFCPFGWKVHGGNLCRKEPQGHCRLKEAGRSQQEKTARVVETAKVEPRGWVALPSTASSVEFEAGCGDCGYCRCRRGRESHERLLFCCCSRFPPVERPTGAVRQRNESCARSALRKRPSPGEDGNVPDLTPERLATGNTSRAGPRG